MLGDRENKPLPTHTHREREEKTPPSSSKSPTVAVVRTAITVTLEALVDEAVQQGAAVVAKGRAAITVNLKLVPRPVVLFVAEGIKEGWRGRKKST